MLEVLLIAGLIVLATSGIGLFAVWWIDRRRKTATAEFNARRDARMATTLRPGAPSWPRNTGHVPPRPMPAPAASQPDTHWRPNRPLTPAPAYVPAPSASSVSDSGDSMLHMMLAQQMIFSSQHPAYARCEPEPEPEPAPCVAYEPPPPSPSYESYSSSCSSDYSSSDSGSSSSSSSD